MSEVFIPEVGAPSAPRSKAILFGALALALFFIYKLKGRKNGSHKGSPASIGNENIETSQREFIFDNPRDVLFTRDN